MHHNNFGNLYMHEIYAIPIMSRMAIPIPMGDSHGVSHCHAHLYSGVVVRNQINETQSSSSSSVLGILAFKSFSTAGFFCFKCRFNFFDDCVCCRTIKHSNYVTYAL